MNKDVNIFHFSINSLKLAENNQDQFNTFMERLKEPNLLSKIKYVESGVNSATALVEIKTCVNEIFSDPQIPYENQLTDAQVANLAFFFPEKAWLNKDNFINRTSFFRGTEAIAMFLEKYNVQRFILELQENSRINLAPRIAMLLALAASHYEVHANSNDESDFLKLLGERISAGPDHGLVRTAILSRAKSLKQPERPTLTRDLPSAMFVTGQLRGYQDGIGSIWKQIPNKDQTDVYVSTWLNPGGSTINRHRLSRRFTTEALDYLKDVDIDYDDLQRYIDKMSDSLDSTKLTRNLQRLFPGARSVLVKIHDESEYPFASMTNPEKMYFQNAYWIHTLGKEEIARKYKNVIKIRPDFRMILDPTKFESITSPDTIRADRSGWLFDVWGFGMADQLLSGNPNNLVDILGIGSHRDISYKLMTHIFERSEPFMGHMNCGLQAWCMGARIESIGGKILSFSEVPRLDLGFIKQYERWKS